LFSIPTIAFFAFYCSFTGAWAPSLVVSTIIAGKDVRCAAHETKKVDFFNECEQQQHQQKEKGLL
jgi:hypothetical protein